MKKLSLFFLFCIICNINCQLPFAPGINGILQDSFHTPNDRIPFIEPILSIVDDAVKIGGGRKRTNGSQQSVNFELSKTKVTEISHKKYKRTTNSYIIGPTGSTSLSIDALKIPVSRSQTIRASYFIKIQTSNRAYAPSFGFLLPNSKIDTLMGTVYWPTNKNGRSMTMYTFMTSDPRYYSNQKNGIADSDLAFDKNSDEGGFNTIKIEIEYVNLGRKTGQAPEGGRRGRGRARRAADEDDQKEARLPRRHGGRGDRRVVRRVVRVDLAEEVGDAPAGHPCRHPSTRAQGRQGER
jgi:hypothetical protein